MKTIVIKSILCPAMLLGASAWTAQAQAPIRFYNSGSTGADGPFTPTVATAGSNFTVNGVSPALGVKVFAGTIGGTAAYFVDVPLRSNGVYNFTAITIPKNMRIRFLLDATQLDSPPPVIFLATGDILLKGEISVTPKDTAWAYSSAPSQDPYDSGNDLGGNRWIPGPGGYRGGKAPTEPGTGPSAGLYDRRGGGQENFCLPLVGGSGASYSTSSPGGPGWGGAGVIYLASSGKVTFDGDYGATSRGLMFGYSYYGWGETGGGSGMAAVFANEVYGTPRTYDNSRLLVSACRQEVVLGKGSHGEGSWYPFWSTGIMGYNMPTNPLVRIIQVGTNAIPDTASQTDVFVVPSSGSNVVTIETRNLPTNITFTIYASRLGMDMTYNNSQQSYDCPPTVSFGGGIARASTSAVQITSGYQFLTARAKFVLQTAMAPTFQGEPLREWRFELDPSGNQRAMYATAKGAVLSQEAAMRLALEQGKWEFIRTFGGQATPQS